MKASEKIKAMLAQYEAERQARQTRRDALDIEVQAAQKAYLAFALVGKSRTPEARAAMEQRDRLEEELIALDTEMQGKHEVKAEMLPAFTRLKRDEQQWKEALYNASQTGNAAGVTRANRELNRIWKELDKLGGL